jgi:hypothetical protein
LTRLANADGGGVQRNGGFHSRREVHSVGRFCPSLSKIGSEPSAGALTENAAGVVDRHPEWPFISASSSGELAVDFGRDVRGGAEPN